LILLRDQAEAAEAEIRSLKASLKASGLPRKVKELEAKAQALEVENKRLKWDLDKANDELLELKFKKPPAHGGTWPGQKGLT
jgi:hypothetical protein